MSILHFGLATDGQMLFRRSGKYVTIGLSYMQIFSSQCKPNNVSFSMATISFDFKFSVFKLTKSPNILSLIRVISLFSKDNSSRAYKPLNDAKLIDFIWFSCNISFRREKQSKNVSGLMNVILLEDKSNTCNDVKPLKVDRSISLIFLSERPMKVDFNGSQLQRLAKLALKIINYNIFSNRIDKLRYKKL